VLPLPSPYCVGLTPVQDTLLWVVGPAKSDLKIYVYNIKDPARPLVEQLRTGREAPTGWGNPRYGMEGLDQRGCSADMTTRSSTMYDATTHQEEAAVHGWRGYGGVGARFAYSRVSGLVLDLQLRLGGDERKFSIGRGQRTHGQAPRQRWVPHTGSRSTGTNTASG